MAQIPEDRVPGPDTRQQHVDDHNEIHRVHNLIEEKAATLETTTGAQAKADAAQAAAVQRANHTGVQPSTTISDFTEAVQDAVAAMLGAGSNVVLTYDDAADTLTIDATGDGTGLDAEAVRDAIGVALVGVGLISVVVNDAADTITVSTTATANSTDAALRDRTTHTGEQAIATVTGLQAALDAKAPVASPALTGTPTVPTAAPGTNTTQAASTAFVKTATDNATYSPDRLVLKAADFGVAAGGPAVGNYPANRGSGWLLDATASERLWAPVDIPADWTTMTITLVWANAGAGSGDVSWVVYAGSNAAGVNLGTLPATSVTAVTTAGAAGVLVHTVTTAVTVPNPGGLNNIAPNRNGPAAADTLANDVALYAVILGKAT